MADQVACHLFAGVKATGKFESSLYISENAETGNGSDLVIRSGSGDTSIAGNFSGDITIFTNDMILNGISGNLTIKSGDAVGLTGNVFIGAGNSSGDVGGDLFISAGDGVGGNGVISIHSNGGDVNFNSTTDVVLSTDFVKTSVIGGMNELMSLIRINPGFNEIDYEEGLYVSAVSLTSTDDAITDVPGCSISISEGVWLISYNVNISNVTAGVASPTLVFLRDSITNAIVNESKMFLNISVTTDTSIVSKKFIYTVSSGSINKNVKLSFQTLTPGAGSSTSSIITSPTGISNVANFISYIPEINAIKISNIANTEYNQNTYTTVSNIAYNGVSEVAVPGCTVDVSAGVWLIGYSFVANVADVADDIIAYFKDGGGTIVNTSKCFVNNSLNDSSLCISKCFIANVVGDDVYSLYFRLNVGTSVSDAIVMSGYGASPSQVPVVWAFKLNNGIEYVYDTYTGAGINWNSTNAVSVMNTGIILNSGTWLVGYDLSLNKNDSLATVNYGLSWFSDNTDRMTNSTNLQYNKSFNYIKNSTSSDRMDISKTFIINIAESDVGNVYNINIASAVGAASSEAVSTDILSGITNPDQVPMLWAVKLNNDKGLKFIDLVDTPNYYTTVNLPVVSTGTGIGYGPDIVSVTDGSAEIFITGLGTYTQTINIDYVKKIVFYNRIVVYDIKISSTTFVNIIPGYLAIKTNTIRLEIDDSSTTLSLPSVNLSYYTDLNHKTFTDTFPISPVISGTPQSCDITTVVTNHPHEIRAISNDTVDIIHGCISSPTTTNNSFGVTITYYLPY